MVNKRIATGFMSIAGALAIAGGATFAFFTDTATSQANAFTTGTLEVDVTNTVAFEPSTPITGMQPGEENFVRFDVTNTGTLPVNLRAFATGDWVLDALDPNKVQVTLVEYWNGSGWADLASAPEGLTGLVYFSSNGAEDGTMFEVPSGDTQEFRLTVKLDESADSTYEAATYNSSVTVHAKQTEPSDAEWPTL